MIGVSIITSTNNPRFFNNILRNYRRQRYRKKELIIILNKNSMKLGEYRKKIRRYKNVSVYKRPQHTSLGRCLNFGIAKAKFPLVAKFDHDDFFSRYYLKEQTKALIRYKAPIVGKRAYFIYLSARKKLIIRFPKKHHRFVHYVQGGTILFKKRINVRFSNRSLGEDVIFMRDCRKKGYKAFATSPYNYVYVRRKDRKSHTWKVHDRQLMRGSKVIAVTKKYRLLATKRF